MERLDQVALFNIAINLGLPELLSFCGSSKRINRLICNKDPIWRYKLNEFKDNDADKEYFLILGFSLRKTYELLYNLSELKRKLSLQGVVLKYSLQKLYNLQNLGWGNNNLTELPKEIGQLVHLKILGLSNNQLTELPKEIKNIKGLRIYK